MIQMQSLLNVADNTGVKTVMCIKVRGTSGRTPGGVGDVIIGSVKKCTPQSRIRKGEKVKGVIVRTKRDIQRDDGSVVRFDENSVVIIDDAGEPVGNRRHDFLAFGDELLETVKQFPYGIARGGTEHTANPLGRVGRRRDGRRQVRVVAADWLAP